MEKGSSTDRRFFPRLDGKLNLKYRIIKSPQKEDGERGSLEQFSVLKNISASGTLFVAFQPLVQGTILEINLELLDTDESIKCLSRVVRVEEVEKDKTYEIAACFLDLSSRDRARLARYVKGEW
jgi:c-di-GMP-binding flagellar brake protein YcgR